MDQNSGFDLTEIDRVEPVAVGTGCLRRDLPSRAGLRIWVVDMAPGSVWPQVDRHGAGGEDVFIVSGEMIEGDRRLPAGSFVHFAPGSAHQPRTETGVRLFGINLLEAA